jgi:hypothetical protein
LGFASALQQAQEVEETFAVDSAAAVDSIQPVVISGLEGGNVPTNSKERGYYILDLLEELEKDILSGGETKAVAKLEEALKSPAVDTENLPQVVRDLMDEIDMRASLEVEKLKAFGKK